MTPTPPVLSDPTYRIKSAIGSGSGGVVYKAWHTRLQKHVIIKELINGSASDVSTQRNEVEALKNVKSPYLPQVFDFLTEGGRIFTVMEFIQGESLDKLLERGQTFTQPQVVRWYGQLASALEAIHKQNVCHRDIKPGNIMLTPGGDVCLIDFNAALVSGNDVRLISRSLGYASPEQYEIYERFRHTRGAPIHIGGSSLHTGEPPDGTETELLPESQETELIESDLTELLEKTGDDTQRTELIAPPVTGGVDWKRSDIYSLGATMYHLLTGRRPAERAREVVPVSKLGRYGEGLVFLIEQSMAPDPAERFATVTHLADAVGNIHKMDSRWKLAQTKKIAAAILLPLAFALFAATAVLGRSVMAQEKEARYFAAVYEIEHGRDPQAAYDQALSLYWDRIDPYRAMAKRLWDDGDVEGCRQYIERNLGNVAPFRDQPDSRRGLGDLYYMLGYCYYLQPGEPDYHTARGNYELAVDLVTDNAVYYRDYAISLARTGAIAEAEAVLSTAQALGLEADSLDLLHGEISFAREDYPRALDAFDKVIATTGDDYLRYRAYHTSDEIFKLQGRPERSVELLTGAMNRIPLNRVPEMTERLADAYIKSGDYQSAVDLFQQLAESGPPQFHILQNLAILLHNLEEYDQAAAVLEQMAQQFPDDYRVPMRQAYLEADRQSRIDNAYRDYALTKQYYDRAATLYADNARPGDGDPEMQQLDALMDQLRQYNWID